MPLQPSPLKKLLWLTGPVGRIRLLLAAPPDRSDPVRDGARLDRALAYLRSPRLVSSPVSRELVPPVLEHLLALALRREATDEAAGYLDQLVATSASVPLARYRRALIEAYAEADNVAAALSHAVSLLRDPAAACEAVADTLRWVLTRCPCQDAERLAQAVHPDLLANPLVDSLAALCLASDEYVDAAEAAKVAARVRPELLADWPELECRAHLVRVACAEATGALDDMLAGALAAAALRPVESAPRYWQARALLHLGRGPEALALLSAAPGQSSEEWQRLRALARLAVESELLARVGPGLDLLRAALGKLGSAEMPLALKTLERALRQPLSPAHERLAAAAYYSARLVELVGQAPWALYYIALNELVVDASYEEARGHLMDGAEAPEGCCPVPLLLAACAALLGSVDDLARAIASLNDPPVAFAEDRRFLVWVYRVLLGLHGDETVDVADGPEWSEQPAGPLVVSAPDLQALGAVLRELACLRAAEPSCPEPPAAPRNCPWAQWFRLRLRVLRRSPAGVAALLGVTDERLDEGEDRFLPLLWARAGALQEAAASVLPSPGRTVEAYLECVRVLLKASPGAHPWHRLERLRSGLVDLRAEADEPGDPRDLSRRPCPWWPLDGALQTLASREAITELCYLEGRHALRRLSPAEALAWFAHARQSCLGESLDALLSRAYFETVLDYWEGVAAAHAGLFDEARPKLQLCVQQKSTKSPEAQVQLGLLALAVGDLAEAEACLNALLPPLPPAAHYLAGLLYDRQGDVSHTRAALLPLEQAGQEVVSVYVPAAHRLVGSLDERQDEPALASEQYRRALSFWPRDPVAVARLARLCLWRTCAGLRDGQPPQPEPALENLWPLCERVAWAADLPVLAAWLDAGWTGLLPTREDGPALPGGGLWSGRGARRILLRALLAAGHHDEAAGHASAWSAEQPDDPYLAAMAFLLARFPLIRGSWGCPPDHDVSAALEDARSRLARARDHLPDDPVVAFWHDVTRLALEPHLAQTEDLCRAGAPSDGRATTRGLVSAALGLFSRSLDRRRESADLCDRLLAELDLPDAALAHVLSGLAAYVRGDDNAFLDHYKHLEDGWPQAVPCAEAELFVAAGRARLRADDLDSLTNSSGFIPDSLADLTHPEIRQVLGLAFARRAAQAVEGSPALALECIQQAMDFLSGDVEYGGDA